MMSADYKKIRESVNFREFWESGNPTDHVSFKLGMYEMSKISYKSGYEMQSRFMIGTSAVPPLEKIFPTGFSWDMISNADLDPNCLMKIFDNQDGTNSRPKISGWNLTYHRDNLAFESGVKSDANTNKEPNYNLIATMWEVRCTNIPTEYDGKLGSVDGPYFFEKESRPAYHAFLNGGCIDERVPYMKYTYEGLDVYTILGWHDPMWLLE